MPEVANSRDTMIRRFFSRFQIMKCFNVFEIRSMENHKAVSLTNEGDKTDDSSLRVGSKWSSASMASSRSIPELYEEKAHRLRVFELSELRRATNDFDRLLKIGEGGFGSVYKGIIKSVNGEENSTAIAVKRLKRGSLQGHKQWIAEVQCLGVVEHPNLVKLIGYCSVDGESGMHRMLVYEYMPNKTLDHHLFNARYPMLPWDTRLQIILGAAQGLAYLHEEMEVQVIYRDFKASNVLLDEKFQPKLSDFGLAREGPTDGKTHVSTAVVGTHGYAAPDYIQTGHLTIKSDVWSFGVVLYELLTGRRSIDRTRPKPQQKLLEWVKNFPSDSKKFPIIMDPRLRNHYPLSVARTVAKLADDCLIKYPKNRPKMSEVVQRLKQAIQDSETSIPIEPSRESTPDFGIRRR